MQSGRTIPIWRLPGSQNAILREYRAVVIIFVTATPLRRFHTPENLIGHFPSLDLEKGRIGALPLLPDDLVSNTFSGVPEISIRLHAGLVEDRILESCTHHCGNLIIECELPLRGGSKIVHYGQLIFQRFN
jgi:hypothetical protein